MPQKPTPQPTPSPTSIRTFNSTSSHHTVPSPRFALPLPNDDPLPTSFAALEGHLNHHASQLQQLADRVESINEWIELDNIVLGRLIRDEEKRVEDLAAAERALATSAAGDETKRAVRFELGPREANGNATGMPFSTPPMLDKSGKRSASLGDVPRSSDLATAPKTEAERKEEAIKAHAGIRE
ncbi:MAG: hypothetical protein Q9201_004109, partial [Fulgogasparrea decipioides]